MPRALTSGMLAAAQAPILYPAIFCQMEFAGGTTVYLWTGTGNISWNGHGWVGIGTFGGVSTIDESSSIEAKGIVLTLSGIDTGLLADVLQNFQIAAPVKLYLGMFDGGAPPSLIADPFASWSGQMDLPTVDVGGQTFTISIACESKLIEMNVPVDRRLCQADQSIDFPGDLAFQFVPGVQEKQISWGRIPATLTGPLAGIPLPFI